jgi:steroid 5-alpha reductase family enzyme
MPLLDLPWTHLGLAFLLSLAISALGFRRIDYFVSLGYAFSIAVQAIVFGFLYRATLDLWTTLQLLMLLAYGARLGSYLIARESAPSFATELAASKERGRHITGLVKVAIWVTVAALYVAMFSPGLFSLWQQQAGRALPSIPVGIVIMIAGLAVESLADWQKARFKAANPKLFCDVGLFRIVRCPNYAGEMLFWLGAFVSGISAYASLAAWLVALIGLACIWLIMVGSARRLEIKQAERYGSDARYQRYVAQVPVLFPLLPIYSLRNWKIYLG